MGYGAVLNSFYFRQLFFYSMKKILIIFCFSIITHCLQAQNSSYNSFDRLEPVGEMPADLKQILLKKNTQKDNVKEWDEKFVFSLLMNGKILYGDPVTQYFNQLLDKIIEQKPELRKEVHIYALKSEQANAFSTPMGNIFVNLGLLARCTNEAELAFIICHELAHYVNFLSEEKLKMNPDKIKDIDDFLKYHSQSRELELLADRSGFLDFFKNLEYDYEIFEDVFDMLQFSHLPFEERKITRGFFENKFYQFSDSYFSTQINPVFSRENYVDTLSTHPNILNRRLEMRKLVGQFSTQSPTVTAYFEKQFKEAKMLAQFESINQMIINNSYLDAYYNSCTLQELYPQQNFLKQTETAALYALYRLKTTGNYKNNVAGANRLTGEIHFPAHVLEKMNKKELAVWALRTAWKAMEINPSNDFLVQIFNEMVKEVVANVGTLNQFCDYRMTDTLVAEQKPDTTVSKGKYDRYKEKVVVAPSPQFKVENYMLADLKQDSKFLDAFDLGILSAEKVAVNKLISKYRKKSKEKVPVVIFQPDVEFKGMKQNENKRDRQVAIFEKDCKRIAKSCQFSPQVISGAIYDTAYSYPVYIKLLELVRNINRLIPLAYQTRQSDELYRVLGTCYLNYAVLSKIKSAARYNADMTFVFYDLKNKKYLINTVRNFKISDKSELYQTLYENYTIARKNIKD